MSDETTPIETTPPVSTETPLPEVINTSEIQTPTTPSLSESEQIVEGNKELAQIRADIASARADQVAQMDKFVTKKGHILVEIANLEKSVEEKKHFLDVVYPSERQKFIAIQNETNQARSRLEADIAEHNRNVAELVKKESVLNAIAQEQKEKESALELKAQDIVAREKAVSEREKAADGLKKVLGIK